MLRYVIAELMLWRQHFETENLFSETMQNKACWLHLRTRAKMCLKAFFCTECKKCAKVLQVCWPSTSELNCKIRYFACFCEFHRIHLKFMVPWPHECIRNPVIENLARNKLCLTTQITLLYSNYPWIMTLKHFILESIPRIYYMNHSW